MSFKRFDWYSGLVAFVSVTWFIVILGSISTPYGLGVGFEYAVQHSGIFCFDAVSFYLILLSVLLWFSLSFFSGGMSLVSKGLISLSVVCSVLSYCCINALWFWVFYELAILPLLLLLILESPYSERYIASWYLLGYVVLTSLPMLLCLFYVSLEVGSYNMGVWSLSDVSSVGVLVLLSVFFITKIPLPPFHTWLPIVHAEASSSVSVCLSGYIMKLGVLGVCRFCSFVLPTHVFNGFYVLLILGVGVYFFMCALRELDGKRWLALLSLSHILIVAVFLSISGASFSAYSLLFCLGHGLSAGVIFMMLWAVYDISGSRNWVVLKSCVSSSLVFRSLCGACLCTAGSLPPTVQFFSEVFVIAESGFNSVLFAFMFFIYMFFSGLVPLFLLGTLLSRHVSLGLGSGYIGSYLGAIFFLVFWSFMLFMVC